MFGPTWIDLIREHALRRAHQESDMTKHDTNVRPTG